VARSLTGFVRGTYSDPTPFWETGARLDQYGINAVFVHSGSITVDLVARARAEGAGVYAEFATLNGKGYVEWHPEAWPINEQGEKAPAATWFLGACPTDPGFRAYRLKSLETLLRQFDLDGIWMDYLHWHAQFEAQHPVLPETCFSATCLEGFSESASIRLPEGSTAEQARWILRYREEEWRDWRCAVLADWVREVRALIQKARPGILLGNFQCPWRDEDFGGARRRILGLDLRLLAALVDVMSPMVYHGRMGRPPSWVGESVAWLSERLGSTQPLIWPIVQAHPEPQPVSAAEFGEVMSQAHSAGATGLMMFTIESVASDPGKLNVLRDLYERWARG
jgi:hypothetical protein